MTKQDREELAEALLSRVETIVARHIADYDHTSCVEAYSALLLRAEKAEVEVAVAMREHWREFRNHRPAGDYLPAGQLAGDCMCGRGQWPCAELLARLRGGEDQ